MTLQELAETLHPLERKVFPVLTSESTVPGIQTKTKLKDVEVMRALQWLENKKLVDLSSSVATKIGIGANGQQYLKDGFPEQRFLKALTKPLSMPDLAKKAKLAKDELNVCLGLLKRQQAIAIDKGFVSLTDQGKKLACSLNYDAVLKKIAKSPCELSSFSKQEQPVVQELLKRKGILKTIEEKSLSVKLTPLGTKLSKVDLSLIQVEERLTGDMLKKHSWKDKKFRRYDVEINVPQIFGGKRHFVDSAVNYIRRIWLDMGFKEMSGSFVNTSFWNMDALFIPQDHPARAMQDTFYLKNPAHGTLPEQSSKIKQVHESGGKTGSTGWQEPWKKEIAQENVLRTHTTVLSAQTIALLKENDLPAKFFSVGKVFRNETLDWSHLFEFYQVEGIVIDKHANFKHLKGYLKEFYQKMGYSDVRMRPAHFPYTEPSVEVDVLHPVHNTWLELGGAGIFRPEVVQPLLGIDVPVLAWGNGLGRIISAYYKLTDIRDLYKNDLKQIRDMKAWLL